MFLKCEFQVNLAVYSGCLERFQAAVATLPELSPGAQGAVPSLSFNFRAVHM